MSAIRVEVTAGLIEAAGDDHRSWDEPMREAISKLTNQDVDIDSDDQDGYVATIGCVTALERADQAERESIVVPRR